jgi:hypothetical protein
MKQSFILLSCLLSIAFLQADPLSTGCGCNKRGKHGYEKRFVQEINFHGGCGCGGGGGNGSNEIPPDHE